MYPTAGIIDAPKTTVRWWSGRVANRDEVGLWLVRYTWNADKTKVASTERLTDDGWVEYEEFEELPPTVLVPRGRLSEDGV